MKKPIASSELQPKSFEFTPQNLILAEKILKRYPEDRKRSAILPLLNLAQSQHEGWLPQAALEYVANMLGLPYIRVYEIASFYSMYNLTPVGKYFLQLCQTTPCWLRGSDTICSKIKQLLKIDVGETTADGLFTLVTVECLGACINAPVIQVNEDYYENLTEDSVEQLLLNLKNKKS